MLFRVKNFQVVVMPAMGFFLEYIEQSHINTGVALTF